MTLARGPGFDAAVDGPLTADPGVILGYTFWQTRMGSDPDIVGKTLTLDGVPHVVVGVAPEHFSGHLALDGMCAGPTRRRLAHSVICRFPMRRDDIDFQISLEVRDVLSNIPQLCATRQTSTPDAAIDCAQ